MTKKHEASTELVPISEVGTEVALPIELITKAQEFAVQARSERTRKEYARCCRDFGAWCEDNGRISVPASVQTVVAYLTWMAGGRGDGKKPAISTVGQAVSAIKLAQRVAGHAFDGDHPMLKEVMQGIRRSIAKERTIRRVKPLMRDDLRSILEQLRNDDDIREVRDAALLSLGWAAALRRSELVGLDWAELGKSDGATGFVTADDKGLIVTLMTSKTSQEEAVTIVVPRVEAPSLCEAVERWVHFGEIARGSPLFRGTTKAVDGGRRAKASRIAADTVVQIIKRRIALLARAQGRKKLTKAETDALVKEFSGHSMRVGYVTSAADRDVPTHRIRQQTRHKSDHMVSVYIRDVDKFKNSGLKGVGF